MQFDNKQKCTAILFVENNGKAYCNFGLIATSMIFTTTIVNSLQTTEKLNKKCCVKNSLLLFMHVDAYRQKCRRISKLYSRVDSLLVLHTFYFDLLFTLWIQLNIFALRLTFSHSNIAFCRIQWKMKKIRNSYMLKVAWATSHSQCTCFLFPQRKIDLQFFAVKLWIVSPILVSQWKSNNNNNTFLLLLQLMFTVTFASCISTWNVERAKKKKTDKI